MRLLRKLIIPLLALAIIGSCVYGYFYFKKVKTPISDAVKAIPVNTAFIIESKQLNATWKKLSQSNLMWQDLKEINFFKELNQSCTYLDSLISSDPGMLKLFENRPVFISAHPVGMNQYGFLYVYSLPEISYENKINSFILKVGPEIVPATKTYDGVNINTLSFPGNKMLSFSFHKGIFIISPNVVLVEDAVRQLNSDISLLNDKNFRKIQEVSGDKKDATIYINYKNLPPFLKQFTNNEGANLANSFSDLASWTEFDLSLKPNELMLNGFTHANDTSNHYLSIFSDQKPQQITITKVIPNNASSLFFYGISNLKTLRKKYTNYLGIKNKLYDNQQYISSINKKYKTDIEKVLLSWVDEEAGVFTTGNTRNELSENCYAIFKTSDSEEATDLLLQLSDSIRKIESLKPDTAFYRGYFINHLPLKRTLSFLWGQAFDKIINNYYTAIDNYIIFGNSIESLKNVINDIENGKVMSTDAHYKDFFDGHLDSDASIYMYSNTSTSTNIYQSFLADEYAASLELHDTLLEKFQAMGIQLSFSKKLIYTTAFVKYNPSHKKQITTLWETELDAKLTSTPQLVINHITQTKEIVVQDEANNLYLISNTGKILWKYPLKEKIIGKITQIDGLKNKKLQLLFNTPSHIYLIDRKGKDVKNFPISLESNASNPLSVFDYNNNREYRILIACENKKIYNYSTQGIIIKGWKPPSTKETVSTPIQHFSIEDKDYLTIIDSKGQLYVLDRQGETKLNVPKSAGDITEPYYIETGKDIGKSYIIAFDTSKSQIIKLTFNGIAEIFEPSNLPNHAGFAYYDINLDKNNEYIFAGPEELMVYNADESKAFGYSFKSNIIPQPLVFNIVNKGTFIGIASPSNNELFLFNNKGNLVRDFPIKGGTLFCMDDMNNDGSIYLIAGGSGNRLFAYQLAIE